MRLAFGAELQGAAAAARVEGYRLQQQGDFAGAIQQYQQALQADPSAATLHNDLGIAYEGLGDLKLAEQHYQAALNLNPEYTEAYSNLALLSEKQNAREQASYYWLQRVKFGRADDPWTARARERLVALGAVRSADEVDALVRQDQQQLKRVIDEVHTQAKAALQAGKYREAIDGFQQVIDLERRGQVEFYSAYAKRSIEEAKQAQDAAEQADLQVAQQRLAASVQQEQQRIVRVIEETYAQAKAALAAGRYREAIGGFEETMSLERRANLNFYTPFAQRSIAEAHQAMQVAETAHLGQALESRNRTVEKTYAEAKTAFEEGRYPEALDGFQRVILYEEQLQQAVYTPFARDYMAQARLAQQRAERENALATQHARAEEYATRTRSSVVEDQFRRNAEALRDFRALTE